MENFLLFVIDFLPSSSPRFILQSAALQCISDNCIFKPLESQQWFSWLKVLWTRIFHVNWMKTSWIDDFTDYCCSQILESLGIFNFINYQTLCNLHNEHNWDRNSLEMKELLQLFCDNRLEFKEVRIRTQKFLISTHSYGKYPWRHEFAHRHWKALFMFIFRCFLPIFHIFNGITKLNKKYDKQFSLNRESSWREKICKVFHMRLSNWYGK